MRREPPKNQRPTRDGPAPVPTGPASAAGDLRTTLAICVFLLIAVLAVFRQTADYDFANQTSKFDFVNFDDPDYVSENPHVAEGFTWQAVRWAFTTNQGSNWHPLTWFSHILDCRIFGLAASGHHLTSVLLHAASAILLFLVLRRMTDRLWPSAFVAAVFAIHPLRVESVVWIAERKDVLSGLFFMLTLAAYAGYVRRPFSWVWYLSVVVLFALGLMAKPMLVTLPFVLLLLDYWPLGRLPLPQQSSLPQRRFPWRLVVEKIPLLLLTAASCIVTPIVQGAAVIRFDAMPLHARIANALVAYVGYIRDSVFPVGLAVYYPHPGPGLSVWKPVAAFFVLAIVSAAAVAGRRKFPYLFVGWFWYVGMLVPVIGVVQVGAQAMADRYTYLPQIGLAIAVAWGAAEFVGVRPYRRWACGVLSVLIVATLMGCAWRQTTYWSDSVTLWEHALKCTRRNSVAHQNLGGAYDKLGRHGDAIEQHEKALAIRPRSADVRYNLGVALDGLKRVDEAMEQYRMALAIDARLYQAHYRLGTDLADRGKPNEAMAELQRALQIKPDYANAHYSIGVLLEREGKRAEAIKWLREAVRLEPNNVAFVDQLAWTLATSPDASIRNGEEAVGLAQRAVKLSKGSEATVLNTLAAAYGEAGRFSEAIETAENAIALAEKDGDKIAADTFRTQTKFYRAGTPYHERSEQRGQKK